MNNKQIIFQVTRTYMKKNLGRTLTTFAGILVMVALMTAVFVGKDTVMQFMTDVVTEDQGSWHAICYGLNADQVKEVQSLPYVERTEVSRPLGYTEFAQSGNPDETPFLELKGYSGELFDWMSIRVKEGRLPEAPGELLLSERALKEGAKVEIGETIDINAFERFLHAFSKGEGDKGFLTFSRNFMVDHGDTKKVPDHFPYYAKNDDFEILHRETGLTGKYTVVGIMESPYYEAPGQGGYIALVRTNPETASGETVNLVLQTDLKSIGDLSFDLNKIVNSTKSEEELAELLQSGHSQISSAGERIPLEAGRVVVNDMLLTMAGKGTDGTLNVMMIFFQAFFIILITAASLLLIYNVFNLSFRERSRYLGMLSSVGATRSQKKWSVYYEIFVLLAVALPIGILLGLMVVKGGMMLLYPYFKRILSMIAENVLNDRSMNVRYHLVVNPANILFVAGFSLLATWISAMMPARKISKVGPIESIRGNEGGKGRGFRTDLRRMKAGKAEGMIASASISRNPYSSKGIVRSIAAFLTLTLVTAFASKMFSDIVAQKAGSGDLVPGKELSGFDYVFFSNEDEDYENYRREIMESKEVSDYKELYNILFSMNVRLEDLSEEYVQSMEKLVGKYFPGGIPEEIRKLYLEPEYETQNPMVNKIVLSDEDFAAVAKKAGISPERIAINAGNPANAESEGGVDKDTGKETVLSEYVRIPALLYDQAEISTENLIISFGGAVKPGYARYQVKRPFSCGLGENIGLFAYDYREEKVVELPVTNAGYVGAEALQDYYRIQDGELWIILSASGNEILETQYKTEGPGISVREMLFNAPTDSSLVRRLANLTDEFGNKVLHPATLNMDDFKTAISKIVKIVAVCFTLLVAVISLLNLYNSVMGRRLALLREQAVLRSLGMTRRQEGHILFYENVRLMLRAILWSACITALFTVFLHGVMSARFGRLLFRMPVGMIVATLATSAASLALFTQICYHKGSEESLSEEIRKENA